MAFSSFDSCVVTKVEPSNVHAYNKLRKDTIDMSSCSVVESIAIAFKSQVTSRTGGRGSSRQENAEQGLSNENRIHVAKRIPIFNVSKKKSANLVSVVVRPFVFTVAAPCQSLRVR